MLRGKNGCTVKPSRELGQENDLIEILGYHSCLFVSSLFLHEVVLIMVEDGDELVLVLFGRVVRGNHDCGSRVVQRCCVFF